MIEEIKGNVVESEQQKSEKTYKDGYEAGYKRGFNDGLRAGYEYGIKQMTKFKSTTPSKAK